MAASGRARRRRPVRLPGTDNGVPLRSVADDGSWAGSARENPDGTWTVVPGPGLRCARVPDRRGAEAKLLAGAPGAVVRAAVAGWLPSGPDDSLPTYPTRAVAAAAGLEGLVAPCDLPAGHDPGSPLRAPLAARAFGAPEAP